MITHYLAQVYGGGAYDTSTYETHSSSGGGTGTGTSGGGGTAAVSKGTLTNTGFDLVLAGTLACAIIFAALLIRFWKRPKATAPVVADD